MSKRTPQQIVEDLAPAYTSWKTHGKDKDKYKDEFFSAITTHLKEQGDQAEEIVYIEADNEESAINLVKQRYPKWTYEDIRLSPDQENVFEIIISENPEFQTFTIDFEDQVWGRQVRSGSTLVDDERLKKDDPDLWLEVTCLPMEDFLLDLVHESGIGEQEAEAYISKIAQRHGVTRTLKSLKDIDQELQPKLQKYIYEGNPSIALPAPKKVE